MVVIHNLPAPLSGGPDMADATCFPEISKNPLEPCNIISIAETIFPIPGIPGPPVLRERIVILPGEA